MRLNIVFRNESNIGVTLPRCCTAIPFTLKPGKSLEVVIGERFIDDIRIWIKKGQMARMLKLRIIDVKYNITIVDPNNDKDEKAEEELKAVVKDIVEKYKT